MHEPSNLPLFSVILLRGSFFFYLCVCSCVAPGNHCASASHIYSVAQNSTVYAIRVFESSRFSRWQNKFAHSGRARKASSTAMRIMGKAAHKHQYSFDSRRTTTTTRTPVRTGRMRPRKRLLSHYRANVLFMCKSMVRQIPFYEFSSCILLQLCAPQSARTQRRGERMNTRYATIYIVNACVVGYIDAAEERKYDYSWLIYTHTISDKSQRFLAGFSKEYI